MNDYPNENFHKTNFVNFLRENKIFRKQIKNSIIVWIDKFVFSLGEQRDCKENFLLFFKLNYNLQSF